MIALAAVALAGCTTVDGDAAFDETASKIALEGDAVLIWDRGGEGDREIDRIVAGLLAEPLTAAAAVQIGLLRNPELQAVYADLGIAQAAVAQAGRPRNPVFDATLDFPEDGGPVSLDFGLAFEFLDLLFVPLRKRVAASELETAKLTVAARVLDLESRLRHGFRTVQASQQRLELFEQVTQAAAASLTAARSLRQAGNITELDLLNELSFAADAQMAREEARLALLKARDELSLLMGLAGNERDWRIDRRLPAPPETGLAVGALPARALEASLALAAAAQTITTQGAQYRVTNIAALIPELEAGLEAERDDGAWEIGPVFALPVPLFDQGQARRAIARYEIERAQKLYLAVADRVRARSGVLEARIAEARGRAIRYRSEILPLTARILDRTQRQFNAMQLGVFELLTAKRRQIAAATGYVEALDDYWAARIDVEALLKGHLPAGGADAARPVLPASRTAAMGDH